MNLFIRLRRRHAPLLAIAAATAVYTSLSVSPAVAAAHDRAATNAACYFNFSSLASLGATASTARGDAREPALQQVTEEVPAGAKGKGRKGFKATVPVYFHVVTPDGVTGNVSLAAINEQIRVMNAGFSGAEGGYDTGFRFTLAAVDRTVNAEWFAAGPSTKAERDMKKALKRGGPNALDYYSTTAGIYLGWAYLPNIVDNATSYLDGIVVDWESMPGTSTRYAGAYDLGKTGTHEAGHWVNLEHTFQGGCNHWGDHVEDTPAMLVPTSGCPEGKDTCAEPGLDPIHNYMDYSYDSCYNQFTQGQAARMQDAYLFWRV
jgi:Pregnancy-associated plasma protein-A